MLPNATAKVGGTRYRPECRFVMSEDAAKTPSRTSEPEAVRKARKRRRIGAGEIG